MLATLTPLSIRHGDIELRTCDIHLLSSGEHVTAEIRQWFEATETCQRHCYVLAYWRRDKEGYDMMFVGSRPAKLSKKDANSFWRLYKRGQKLLTKHFNLDDNGES